MLFKQLMISKKFELCVGICFLLIGFFVGSNVINSISNGKIKLDRQQESIQPEYVPYAEVLEPKNTERQPFTEEMPALVDSSRAVSGVSPSSKDNEFENLTREQMNCMIWKNAHPEAAFKLRQGDACY